MLSEHKGLTLHRQVRRWLKQVDTRWRQLRPTLVIRDPRKAEYLQAINEIVGKKRSRTEVFYVDEADIDFNPRIGPAWMERGIQETIPTPGKNQKHYIAGALHAHTRKVIWSEWERKNSLLFISLLHKLNRTYRRAKRIISIVYNYIIHKSGVTLRWLQQRPKFQLLFQPFYHPWVNHIERLWKVLTDTVTRNQRCKTMDELLLSVRQFLIVAQPFPGNDHALARL